MQQPSSSSIDPDLSALRDEITRLTLRARRRGRLLGVLAGTLLALVAAAGSGVVDIRQQLASCRAKLVESRQAHSALVHGDADPFGSPFGGVEAWAHRFTITMYTARSAAYGKFDDGLTATMTKADPKRRIVAVDPQLIPYRSKVWIEGLGWYTAEDCGSAIKGLEIDVMADSYGHAMQFGRQQRRVVVLPPDAGVEA